MEPIKKNKFKHLAFHRTPVKLSSTKTSIAINADRAFFSRLIVVAKIVSEFDQEIPQSQTADNPVAPRGRAAQPSRDTRNINKQSNQLSLPHQDDFNTRMDIK